jgi:predicted RNase H-like HicB family nuclease
VSTEKGVFRDALDLWIGTLDKSLAEGSVSSSEYEELMQAVHSTEMKETILKKSFAGEVLSFLGQLPVLIKGDAEEGDYIIPVDNEPYCMAKNADETTFQEYKKVLGTVWEKIERDEEVEFIKPVCAVGIK